MVNLPREALHGRFDQWLSTHVSNQVLNRPFGLWPVCLASEVDGDQWTCLYERMCEEHLQEQAQLLASLLEEGGFHVSNILLLGEGRCAISAADLPLDHGLELAEG